MSRTPPPSPSPDVDAVLKRLRSARGRDMWECLDQLVDIPDFRKRVEKAFPAIAAMGQGWQRRDMLKCFAASFALAGLTACERRADEEARPYVNQPDGIAPGDVRYYATAVELDGIAQPVIGKTFNGRPIKLEGNPDHPASGGATDAFTQAALLGLYDPDRSPSPAAMGQPTSWDDFEAAMVANSARLQAGGGAGFRLLTGPVGSPTLLRQIEAMLAQWPQMAWHVHDPIPARTAPAGFRRNLDLAQAQVIVSLDDDLLGPGPMQTFHAGGWSQRRRAYQAGDGSALLFVAEPSPTLTGVAASDRLPCAPGRVEVLLAALESALGGGAPLPLTSRERQWVTNAASALAANRGRGLVSAGPYQPVVVQQRAAALNGALGNEGRSGAFQSRPQIMQRAQPLDSLVAAMRGGAVDTLLILGSNPVYSAPPAFQFAAALSKVRHSIHAGLHNDETAHRCAWHVPLTHALESWSDGVAADGSAVIIQPLVQPFLDVRSRHDVLAMVAGAPDRGRGAVQQTWAAQWGAGAGQAWEQALVKGMAAPAAPSQAVPASPRQSGAGPAADAMTLLVRPDPTIHDGSFATNPWLQELPKPLTKLTWGNAVHIAPALADSLGVSDGDVVTVSADGRSLSGPAIIVPGQDRRTILVHLGYGRSFGGSLSQGLGFDAYAMLPPSGDWALPVTAIRRTGDHSALVTTQKHFTMAGKDFVRFVEKPDSALPPPPHYETFYGPVAKSRPQWAMAIDLDLCIGCNACVTACVAENNIPMVGKDEVALGREMQWIRIDHYHEGPSDEAKHMFQPVPCMHCEDAPCEMGCPVNATVHSPDGLNLQVYNRCVGTRTCSAYCPYKVRRFNWHDFTSKDPPELRAARNPDVTVRSRGVMEKCTYCIQRINETRIAAELAGSPIGKVTTACEQACPTQAIVFGDITDPKSEVSRRKAAGRDYMLLEESNTRPRTTYQARIERGDA